jgi:hypothetical protein
MNPGDFTRIRRKLRNGADLVTGFRFARLFHDGGAIWVTADPHVMWFRLTKAIETEKWLSEHRDWAHDHNRICGLHQCRIWLRRNWKRLEAKERTAA